MQRRDFLKKAGIGAAATIAATAGILGCGEEEKKVAAPPAKEEKPKAPEVVTKKTYEWKMVTTWPPKMPVLQDGCERLAKRIEELSDGRIKIQVFAAGELVPAMESFQAVSDGTVEVGSGAAYYWAGKDPAVQWFSAVPFGMNAQGMSRLVPRRRRPEALGRGLCPVQPGAAPRRLDRRADGRLVQQEDQHHRRLQGAQDADPRPGRQGGGQGRRHGGADPRRGDLHQPGARGHRRHRVGRPAARPAPGLLQGRQVLLLPRLARARDLSRILLQQEGLRRAAQ